MKLAIVGTGISGLTAGYLLQRQHEVTLFEANNYIGGHTNTVTVIEGKRRIPVDTGFIVFNPVNYPNLCKLFDQLGVESRGSDMSFSVHCEKTGLEYNGTSLVSLFCQQSNLVRPGFWRMLRDIMRFHREAPVSLQQGLDDQVTVGRYVFEHGYSENFIDHYLVPLGASLWSCPSIRFREFPMRFVIEFLANHHMLQVDDRPQWKTVRGGSASYVQPLTRSFRHRIHLSSPVQQIRRCQSGVRLTLADGNSQEFDEVIIACHANQALRLLAEPRDVERELLGHFQYQHNDVVLHTDHRLLPDRPRAWASWNYRIPETETDTGMVTYNMNMLQGLESDNTYCVSLNQAERIDPAKVIYRVRYQHPQFSQGRNRVQAKHADVIRNDRLSFCGAYWGFGFHEDGVNSALRVCAAFDEGLS